MKDTLNYLSAHKTLSSAEAREVLMQMAEGKFNESEMAAFLAIYLMRTITVEELEGFRSALLELCIYVDLSPYNAIDLCGTGGDGKDTFNISTLASFVAAGAGLKVAKHGNYGVSSVSGSSNMMEYFGIRFTNDQEVLKKQIEECNICFLHAPLFHPALKHVAPVRKSLRVKTFFNMLGPMVNPAKVKNQVIGVFNLELARIYSYLYQQTDCNYNIIHALDGYDEVSLTGAVKLISPQKERLIDPDDFGATWISPAQIKGGRDVPEMAAIFKEIIEGRGTQAQNDVVCANAAMAIHCVYPELALADAFQLALESLRSGAAFEKFHKLISIQ